MEKTLSMFLRKSRFWISKILFFLHVRIFYGFFARAYFLILLTYKNKNISVKDNFW